MIVPHPPPKFTLPSWAVIGAMMIRLLLVGDQPSVRKGLQMLLAAEPDLVVVGEASDVATVLDQVSGLHPDVIVMDVDMSRLNGLVTVDTLQTACPQAAIIVLSIHDDAKMRGDAAAAGAVAFIAKSMPVDMLLTAIRQVAGQRGSGSTATVSPLRPKEG